MTSSAKFTADQLAGVYVSRWHLRDMTNSFIQHLRPVSLFTGRPNFQRNVPFTVALKIKLHRPIDNALEILNPAS